MERQSSLVLFAVLIPLTVRLPAVAQDAAEPGVFRTEYELDPAAAREAGIATAEMDEAETRRAIAADLERRLAYRAPEGVRIAVTDGEAGRLVATITGALSEQDAALLRADAGALELLRFLAVAEEDDLAALGTSVRAERDRLTEWIEAHAGEPLAVFRHVRRDEGGPLPRLLWADGPRAPGEAAVAEGEARAREALALLIPEDPAEEFRAADLESVQPSFDELGYPALAIEIRAGRAEAYGRFTERIQGKRLAVLLRGRVQLAPNVNDRLPPGSILSAHFTEEEVREIVAALSSPPVAAAVRPLP